MTTVDFELIKKIRLHINRTEKQAELLSNRQKWMRLTSALDVLEDTSWAIEYYINSIFPDEIRGKYLYTYGLLQALFVQEDAANSLSIALFDQKIDFERDYPSAFSIREIRNDVIGHPTQRGANEYIYLAQCSLSKGSFYYIKENSDSGEFDSIDVDVFSVIDDAASCVNSVLQEALNILDVEFKEYIEKHRGRKMKEIFNLLNYAREKALLDAHMGEWGYSATKGMVEKCENELALRYGSVEAMDSYKYLLDEIHELYSLIDNGVLEIPAEWRAMTKKYLLQSLFAKLGDLEKYCEETDAYFENYGEEYTPIEGTEKVTVIFGEDELDIPEENGGSEV